MLSAKLLRRGGVGIVLTCLFSAYATSLSFAQTTPTSPWLGAANPTLEKHSEVNLARPLPESIIGSRGCQEREVITRPQRFVAPLQAKVSHQSCVVDTAYGAVANNGYLQRAGSSISGELRTSKGDQAIMMPIPRNSTGLRLSGGSPYGNFLFFYDDLEPNLSSKAIYNGEVEHRLPTDYSAILKNGNGELLSVDTTGASFSANGDWIVADIPFLAMVRINTKTREILPFADASNPFSGLGAAFRTAISPDGRYAFVASRTHEILRLYDLTTCATPPRVITTKVSCNSRDLLPFMRQQIPGFTSLASVRFHSNYTLSLYANTKVNDVAKLTRYVAVAAGQQATGFQYLALGDSFASGEGAYRYKAATDVTYNKCHLSQRSYPYLISSELGYGQYESVACSGAVIEDLITDNKDYVGQAKDGIRLKDRSYDDFLPYFRPGYLPQKEFGKRHQPQVVTISAGGNDIGFKDIIIRCIDTDTCYDSYEDRLELAQLINEQFDRLTGMYNDLKTSADPRAKIYVIGYPQIAKVDGVCDINVHLNRDERVFAEQLVSHLNGVIKKAAENAGVFYVDVEDAFNGRKMCEPMWSWEVAVNGLTAGNDQVNLPYVHGPIGNESYHPNALGHDLFKTKILQKTNNFTAVMPVANPNAKPNNLDANTAFLQSPKSNRIIRSLKHSTGTEGGVIRAGVYWGYEMSGLDDVFAAGSEVAAWLKSDPVNLGTYKLSASGSITIGASIPSSVTPGFHTLHLLGKNSSGEDIDVFKTVYVETGSPCLVPMSGQDRDKDGTDDACDGFIGQPPAILAAKQLAASVIDNSRGNHLLEHIISLTSSRHENPQVLASTTGQSNTSTGQPTILGINSQTPAETEKPKTIAALPQKTSFNPAIIIVIIVLLVFLVSVFVIAL